MGFLGAFFLFLSVLVHELTHSYIAKREGIEVKEITLFIFGGVSQLTKEPEDSRKELKVAIGGPLSSLVLALIFWICLKSDPPVTPPHSLHRSPGVSGFY